MVMTTEKLTENGFYLARYNMGGGLSSNVILIVRGAEPFVHVRAFFSGSDQIEEVEGAAWKFKEGLIKIINKVSDL